MAGFRQVLSGRSSAVGAQNFHFDTWVGYPPPPILPHVKKRLADRFPVGGLQSFHAPLPLAHRLTPRAASALLLTSWHAAHRPCSLLLSSAPPSDSGMMWSRCVATVTRPSAWHITHSGLLVNNCARIRCSLRPVTRLVVIAGLAHAGLGCASQRPDPSRTSLPQPGAVQGLGAAHGMVGLQRVDLNHRPPGYEPDELPDCSTLRNKKPRWPFDHRGSPASGGWRHQSQVG